MGESCGMRITSLKLFLKKGAGGFPGGAVVDNLPANAGDTGSSPGLGRSHMLRSQRNVFRKLYSCIIEFSGLDFVLTLRR